MGKRTYTTSGETWIIEYDDDTGKRIALTVRGVRYTIEQIKKMSVKEKLDAGIARGFWKMKLIETLNEYEYAEMIQHIEHVIRPMLERDMAEEEE